MSQHRKAAKDSESLGHAMPRFQGLSDPAISEYVARLKSRYGKYALSGEEAMRIVDKSMGDKSLTEVLYQSREYEQE